MVARQVTAWTLAVALLVAAGAALLAGADRAGGAFPGQDGLIAFDRTVKNNKGGFADRIVTVKQSGKGLGAITPKCCKLAEDPAWSADGKLIAFTLNRYVHTMNKKGKKRERLTKGKKYNGKKFEDLSPSFSPDGSRVVFARQYVGDFTTDLFLVDSDGSNLLPLESSDLDPFDPVWSPDGEWIAFVAGTLGAQPQGIYRMRPDGSDLQLVVALNDLRDGLDYSPDGAFLAFSTRADGSGPEVFSVRADGSDRTKLTDETKPAFDPAYSPTGSRIVFSVGGVLKLMGADGSNVKKLLKKSGGIGDTAPSWQPK